MTHVHKPRALVVTVSDSASRGERQDLSGPAVQEELEKMGCMVKGIRVVPDEVLAIQSCLSEGIEDPMIDLIVTTGGTGLAPRDVTPEATAVVIEKTIPGMAELMRAEGAKSNSRAVLSRGVVGIRNKTMIINLPGSVKGVRESLAALRPVLGHALEVASGNTVRCGG